MGRHVIGDLVQRLARVVDQGGEGDAGRGRRVFAMHGRAVEAPAVAARILVPKIALGRGHAGRALAAAAQPREALRFGPDARDRGPGEGRGAAAGQGNIVLAETRPVELDPALEGIGIDLGRIGEIAQLDLHGLGDIAADLVRMGLDQHAASARIADIQDQIDIDRRRGRLGVAVDHPDLGQQVHIGQQIDQRLVAGDVLLGAFQPLEDLLVAHRPGGAAAFRLFALDHVAHGFAAPIGDPFFLHEPVERLFRLADREGGAALGVILGGGEIGFALAQRQHLRVEGDQNAMVEAVLVRLGQAGEIDARPVGRAVEIIAALFLAQHRNGHPGAAEGLDQLLQIDFVAGRGAVILGLYADGRPGLAGLVVEAPIGLDSGRTAAGEAQIDDLNAAGGDKRQHRRALENGRKRHGSLTASRKVGYRQA